MRLLPAYTLACLCSIFAVALGELALHDANFQPDVILRVTAQNISQACNTRYSAVVNGTAPGPTITLKAGRPAWIRVYNDMPDANLTMVGKKNKNMQACMIQIRDADNGSYSTGMVLHNAWLNSQMALH